MLPRWEGSAYDLSSGYIVCFLCSPVLTMPQVINYSFLDDNSNPK